MERNIELLLGVLIHKILCTEVLVIEWVFLLGEKCGFKIELSLLPPHPDLEQLSLLQWLRCVILKAAVGVFICN